MNAGDWMNKIDELFECLVSEDYYTDMDDSLGLDGIGTIMSYIQES